MPGVYNKMPPKPTYCFVWNIETVQLSTKMLILKLTMLLH